MLSSRCKYLCLVPKWDAPLREFESQFFGTIEQQILEAHQREEVEIKNSNHYFSELVDLRNECQMILSDISKAATPFPV